MANATPNSQPHRPYRLKKILTNHALAVSCVKFSYSGALFASASLDKTLIVYSTETLAEITRLIGHTEGVSDLAWSCGSSHICSASDDRTVRIWDVRASECVKTLKGHTDRVFCVNFDPLSTKIVSGAFDDTVRVWEVKTGNAVHVLRGHTMPVTAVHFNRDGSLIVSGSHDGSCKIWDSNTGSVLMTMIDAEVPAVSFAKFSPNGKFILVATLDDTLKLWNYSAEKFLKVYTGHVNKSYCLMPAFSVSGEKYIVSGSEDNCVCLWSLQGNLVQKLEGHTDTVICVSCHPTVNMIVSAGLDKDRTVRVWVQQ